MHFGKSILNPCTEKSATPQPSICMSMSLFLSFLLHVCLCVPVSFHRSVLVSRLRSDSHHAIEIQRRRVGQSGADMEGRRGELTRVWIRGMKVQEIDRVSLHALERLLNLGPHLPLSEPPASLQHRRVHPRPCLCRENAHPLAAIGAWRAYLRSCVAQTARGGDMILSVVSLMGRGPAVCRVDYS